MDDAELAQKLGEAMRLKSSEISNGAVAQFRKLKDNVSIDVTMVLTDDGHLHFKNLEPKAEPTPLFTNTVNENTDVFEPPVLEAQTVEEVEEKPKRKRKTQI